jgi:hypothetical protein
VDSSDVVRVPGGLLVSGLDEYRRRDPEGAARFLRRNQLGMAGVTRSTARMRAVAQPRVESRPRERRARTRSTAPTRGDPDPEPPRPLSPEQRAYLKLEVDIRRREVLAATDHIHRALEKRVSA